MAKVVNLSKCSIRGVQSEPNCFLKISKISFVTGKRSSSETLAIGLKEIGYSSGHRRPRRQATLQDRQTTEAKNWQGGGTKDRIEAAKNAPPAAMNQAGCLEFV